MELSAKSKAEIIGRSLWRDKYRFIRYILIFIFA
jgi:hypothetical protein